MNKLTVLGLVSLLSVSIMFSSCASSGGSSGKNGKGTAITEADYLAYLNAGDFASCIQYLEGKNAKNVKKESDYIRDYFDIAMMHHFSQNYKESLGILNEVDMLMHDALTESISKGIGAAVLNENIADYAGAPYEYIYINIFNALNYYNAGDVDEAAVEVRKLNDKKKEYLVKYGEILQSYDPDGVDANEDAATLDKAYKTLKMNPSDFNGAKPAPSTEDDIFKDSPLARYLSLVFYMMDKDDGNAQYDAQTLNVMNASFDSQAEVKIPRGQGRLDVLAFTGLIARRGEARKRFGPFKGITIPTPKGDVVIPPFDLEFVYPVFPAPEKAVFKVIEIDAGKGLPKVTIEPGRAEILPKQPDSIASVRLTMSDGTTTEFSLLEDLNKSVQMDVNTKSRTAYNRSVGRSITKKVSAMTAGSATLSALPRGDSIKEVAYGIGYTKVAKAIDIVDETETADIRQVYALPGKALATGINLAPGKYSFKVDFISADGKIVETQQYNDITVKAGVPTLVEAVCRK